MLLLLLVLLLVLVLVLVHRPRCVGCQWKAPFPWISLLLSLLLLLLLSLLLSLLLLLLLFLLCVWCQWKAPLASHAGEPHACMCNWQLAQGVNAGGVCHCIPLRVQQHTAVSPHTPCSYPS